jgi:pyridoxamine 5'-phosphate oxidase family protein
MFRKTIKVAVIIDDLKTVDSWDPRGVRIYGTADSYPSRWIYG